MRHFGTRGIFATETGLHWEKIMMSIEEQMGLATQPIDHLPEESPDLTSLAALASPKAVAADGKRAMGLQDAIAALKQLQAQFRSWQVAEHVLTHLSEAGEAVTALEGRKAALLDEISRLEQRHETSLAITAAAEEAGKVRLQALEDQIKAEEARLSTERERLEVELNRLRGVLAKLSASVADLKI